jgi:hypothetical protein
MMSKTSHRANGSKQGARLKDAMRQQRLANMKRNSEPLIPSRILKALAAMGLPKDRRVYNARLKELLRG